MESRGAVAVSGASGFIGRTLVARLVEERMAVKAVLRRASRFDPAVTSLVLGDLAANTDWTRALEGVRSVVHLAGRAHQPLERDPEDWMESEIAAARHLAISTRGAGVERLILMSSIKVHGEASGRQPFRAGDAPAPADSYAVAKARIEAAMADALAGSATALAIIRPPLVYGPGVKANFRALLGLVKRAPALPFASLRNRRSMIYAGNLVDFVVALMKRPQAAAGIFLVSDGEPLSTPELVRRLGRHLGHVPLLLPCPVAVLRLVAGALGRGDQVERLVESLELDDRATRDALAWQPPFSIEDGLGATCRWFLGEVGSR